MFIRPYFLFGMFMEIAAASKIDKDNLIACMAEVSDDDIQFFNSELY